MHSDDEALSAGEDTHQDNRARLSTEPSRSKSPNSSVNASSESAHPEPKYAAKRKSRWLPNLNFDIE